MNPNQGQYPGNNGAPHQVYHSQGPPLNPNISHREQQSVQIITTREIQQVRRHLFCGACLKHRFVPAQVYPCMAGWTKCASDILSTVVVETWGECNAH